MFEEKDRGIQTHQSILFLLDWLTKTYTNVPLTYQRSYFGNIAYNAKLRWTDQFLIMIYEINQQNTNFKTEICEKFIFYRN